MLYCEIKHIVMSKKKIKFITKQFRGILHCKNGKNMVFYIIVDKNEGALK